MVPRRSARFISWLLAGALSLVAIAYALSFVLGAPRLASPAHAVIGGPTVLALASVWAASRSAKSLPLVGIFAIAAVPHIGLSFVLSATPASWWLFQALEAFVVLLVLGLDSRGRQVAA